jgi:hypothetical protein
MFLAILSVVVDAFAEYTGPFEKDRLLKSGVYAVGVLITAQAGFVIIYSRSMTRRQTFEPRQLIIDINSHQHTYVHAILTLTKFVPTVITTSSQPFSHANHRIYNLPLRNKHDPHDVGMAQEETDSVRLRDGSEYVYRIV